jgi:hypothetical protein
MKSISDNMFELCKSDLFYALKNVVGLIVKEVEPMLDPKIFS